MVQEATRSPELCLRVRVELVDLANCATSDKAARSLTLPPAPSLPLSLVHALSLPLIATTPPPPPPLLSSSSSSFSFPSLSALEANALAGLQASCCQIGGPYSRWQRLKQWLGKERGEDERRRASNRKRKRESWREKGKKEAALVSASGRMRSSNIDSALSFFFPILCSALPGPPICVCVCVCVECVCVRVHESRAGPRDQNRHHHQLHFAKDFFFFFFFSRRFFGKHKGTVYFKSPLLKFFSPRMQYC